MSTTATWGQAKTFTLSVDGTVLTSQSLTGTTLWYTWDTTATANGTHTLTVAVSMNGQTATATLPVTVSNAAPPLLPPLTAAFTAPTAGATVQGVTTVGMASSGASGSSTFQLSLDGTIVSTQTVSGASATHDWNTTTVGNGSHALSLIVTDGAGRTATATVTVTVSNAPPPPPPPLSASFTAPTAGAKVRGITTVGMASSGALGASSFKLAVDGTVVWTQTVSGTTASYAWNTTTVSKGTHTLTLTVTDGAARTATATITVTVSNPGGPK
jgi:hypothetical protein